MARNRKKRAFPDKPDPALCVYCQLKERANARSKYCSSTCRGAASRDPDFKTRQRTQITENPRRRRTRGKREPQPEGEVVEPANSFEEQRNRAAAGTGWIPTDAERNTVANLARYGLTQDEVADWLGVHPHTLRQKCDTEYKLGRAQAVTSVMRQMFTDALNEDFKGRTTAQIFWLKVNANRTERQVIEVSREDLIEQARAEAARFGLDEAEAVALAEEYLRDGE